MKPTVSSKQGDACASLPMRERELKLGVELELYEARLSLPMRERELKLRNGANWAFCGGRSPCGSVN